MEEGFTQSEKGNFSVFCAAPLGPEANCMNSAEWPSREDMNRELAIPAASGQ